MLEKTWKKLTCRNSTILFLKQNPAFDLLQKKKRKCKDVKEKQKLLVISDFSFSHDVFSHN